MQKKYSSISEIDKQIELLRQQRRDLIRQENEEAHKLLDDLKITVGEMVLSGYEVKDICRIDFAALHSFLSDSSRFTFFLDNTVQHSKAIADARKLFFGKKKISRQTREKSSGNPAPSAGASTQAASNLADTDGLPRTL